MENWVERKTPQGKMYYCNLITQETTWDYDDIDENTGQLVNIYIYIYIYPSFFFYHES
jgi:hypothetical protein